MHQKPIGTGDQRLLWLTKLGGVAALIAALVFRRWLGAEYLLLRSGGVIGSGPIAAPHAAGDWFALLETHRLVGLVLLNAFDIINYVLVGVIFLALIITLQRGNRTAVSFASVLGFAGIVIYLAANPTFALLSLSDQYAAATGASERGALIARGQSLLALADPHTPGPGVLGFLLVTLAELIFAVLMLRSKIFGKKTAYVGIVANTSGLGYPAAILFAPAAMTKAMVAAFLSLSAPFLLVWYLLIARSLLWRAERHISPPG